MKSKFEFRPIEKTYSDPVTASFRPGIPFGREFSRGDVVLLHPEISSSKIFLNSNILREALLNSKSFIEEKLGLVIVEALPEIKENKKAANKRAKDKKAEEVKEEVTIEGVTEIPEGAEVVDEVVIDAPEEVAEELTEALNDELVMDDPLEGLE